MVDKTKGHTVALVRCMSDVRLPNHRAQVPQDAWRSEKGTS